MEVIETIPEGNANGISLKQLISITFDEEIDVDSIISEKRFIVTSSAFKVASRGPGFEDFIPFVDDYLESEVFSGLIAGEITTKDSLTFTFTPSEPLQPNTLYRVIVSNKVLSKTIGSIVSNPGNTSTGGIACKGPYRGDEEDDTWEIRITEAGVLGTATFIYTRSSNGLPSDPLPTDRLVELEDGIAIKFTSGSFVVGDSWEFTTEKGTPLDNIYEFSFTTGAPEAVDLSEESPSVWIDKREVQGLSRVDNLPSVNSGTLSLLEIIPSNRSSDISISNRSIVLIFNKELDPDSIDEAQIKVIMESLPLDESQQVRSPLHVTPTVSGKTLTLTFTG